MKKHYGLVGFALMMFSVFAYAGSPVTMLEQTSNQLISKLKANKAKISTNKGLVFRYARQIILPKVDLTTMSRSVLGRSAWNGASSAEKKAFKREFTTMLVRTYGSAFASYTDEQVTFHPVRGGYQGRKRVKVDSVIVRNSGPSIPVSYRLMRYGSSWKVYDLSVEGVSLIQSFRSQFSSELRVGGMPALLARMRKHNGH
jgi:phospholipid transport system substrate-binding protein